MSKPTCGMCGLTTLNGKCPACSERKARHDRINAEKDPERTRKRRDLEEYLIERQDKEDCWWLS